MSDTARPALLLTGAALLTLALIGVIRGHAAEEMQVVAIAGLGCVTAAPRRGRP